MLTLKLTDYLCGTDLTLNLLRSKEFSLADYRTGKSEIQSTRRIWCAIDGLKMESKERKKPLGAESNSWMTGSKEMEPSVLQLTTRNLILPTQE